MIRALLLLMLLTPTAGLAAGGGHGGGEEAKDEGDPFAVRPIEAAPSYRAFPEDIVTAMRNRILEQRGELPAPAEPEPEAEGGHGTGH